MRTTAPAAADRIDPVGRGAGARRIGPTGLVLGAVAVLLLCAAASVFIGAEAVSPTSLLDDGTFDNAILDKRVVRTCVALAAGAALAVGGACLQGLTRNPLADSGLLGLNAGAAFAVVVSLTYGMATALEHQLWFAFLGTAVAALLVHGVASFGGGATPGKLVLAGTALTAALSSWTTALLLLDHKTFDVFRRWQVGAIGSDRDALLTCLPFLVAGAVLAFACVRVLDTLALGDDLAKGLGRRTGLDRAVVGLAVVLLIGAATALVGPIYFVGLLVPHAVRAVAGGAYGAVLPLSAAGGAALVALADTIGRVVLPPQEVQVGIMAAVLGVPGFVVLLRRGRTAGL